jgi:hypothetical protein
MGSDVGQPAARAVASSPTTTEGKERKGVGPLVGESSAAEQMPQRRVPFVECLHSTEQALFHCQPPVRSFVPLRSARATRHSTQGWTQGDDARATDERQAHSHTASLPSSPCVSFRPSVLLSAARRRDCCSVGFDVHAAAVTDNSRRQGGGQCATPVEETGASVHSYRQHPYRVSFSTCGFWHWQLL